MEKIAINDAVVHVPEGVCTVTSIIERDLASLGIRQYYVLEPVYDRKSKIFVPIEGNGTKVRGLPDKEEVLSAIDEIPEAESVWIENDKARLESFSDPLRRVRLRPRDRAGGGRGFHPVKTREVTKRDGSRTESGTVLAPKAGRFSHRKRDGSRTQKNGSLYENRFFVCRTVPGFGQCKPSPAASILYQSTRHSSSSRSISLRSIFWPMKTSFCMRSPYFSSHILRTSGYLASTRSIEA